VQALNHGLIEKLQHFKHRKSMFFIAFNRQQHALNLQVDPEIIRDGMHPFAQPDKWGHLSRSNLLVVQTVTWNTAASELEPAPYRHAASGVLAISWARLDNRDELAGMLGIAAAEAKTLCDSEWITRVYLKWGEDGVNRLVGDFVFALYDPRSQKIFCARDHMGVRPLYYHLSDRTFVCATNLGSLTGFDGVPADIDEAWMADYLSALSMSFDRTPYKEIRKLPPAHCLSVSANRRNLRQYANLADVQPLELKDSQEYVDAYREQLEQAILCRLDSNYPIGAELSGGIDSSTITAFAARAMRRSLSDLHTFGFAHLDLEPEYILAVSRSWRLPINHIVTGRVQDPLTNRERGLKILGYPKEHSTSVYHEPFYQLAERLNIRTLLSGFGGDEFATTIHGYMVPMEMLAQGRYWEAFQILEGNPLLRSLRMLKLSLRKVRSKNFTREEYHPGMYQGVRKRWPHQILNRETMAQYDLQRRCFGVAKFDAGYTDLKKFTLEKRWAPFVPTRMENCQLMAAARNIEYRWPLLDIRLVKLFLSIPSEENYHRGMGRYLHRRAIQGVVPDLVTWKRSKDMGSAAASLQHMPAKPAKSSSPVKIVNAELHPELLKLIDNKKFQRQLDDVLQQNRDMSFDKIYQYRRNISSVNWLNEWLWRTSPKRK
jgi:asparagine synthase (glutamine-hydrolysing)